MDVAQEERQEKHAQSMKIAKLVMLVEGSLHGLTDKYASLRLQLEPSVTLTMIV